MEVQRIQSSKSTRDALFVPVKIDVQCGKSARTSLFMGPPENGTDPYTPTVLFFKTREPVEPVSFVHRICEDASKDKSLRRTRFVKRLTPMTRMGKASEKGLEDVAKAVLGPVFHGEQGRTWKVCLMIISGHDVKLHSNKDMVAVRYPSNHTQQSRHEKGRCYQASG